MAKKVKPEEIIEKTREVDVRLSRGKGVGEAVKSIDSFPSLSRGIHAIAPLRPSQQIEQPISRNVAIIVLELAERG